MPPSPTKRTAKPSKTRLPLRTERGRIGDMAGQMRAQGSEQYVAGEPEAGPMRHARAGRPQGGRDAGVGRIPPHGSDLAVHHLVPRVENLDAVAVGIPETSVERVAGAVPKHSGEKM